MKAGGEIAMTNLWNNCLTSMNVLKELELEDFDFKAYIVHLRPAQAILSWKKLL